MNAEIEFSGADYETRIVVEFVEAKVTGTALDSVWFDLITLWSILSGQTQPFS